MKKSVYNRVEELYESKNISFQKIEKKFSEDFNIDIKVIRDTIKRILVETFDNGQKEHLLNYKFTFKDFFIYYIVMFYFLLLSLFGLRKKSTQKFDILFENWSGNNFVFFYKRIYQELYSQYKIAIFDVAKKSSKDFYPKNTIVVDKKSNHKHYYSQVISFKIFKTQFNKFFYYQKISKESEIDIINISLRLYRYIAVYNTDVLNLNAKILISAGDNYYNSLRYFIYTNHGIDKILLIQNGYRGGESNNSSGDMYTYCDYYLGFGKKNIEEQKGMVCKNKLSIGSLRLYDNTLNVQKKEVPNDIVFIEQLALGELALYKESKYVELIDLLCKFAINNKKYKIVYKTRPNRMKYCDSNNKMLSHINKIDNKLKNANILIDDIVSKNSYEAIINSNVVVYYTSSMGIEALGLEKKVLCFNPDKLSFQIAIEDEIGVLIEADYSKFEQKILYLLNNNDDDIENYYKNKKNNFMNLRKDPVLIIKEIVEKEIDI